MALWRWERAHPHLDIQLHWDRRKDITDAEQGELNSVVRGAVTVDSHAPLVNHDAEVTDAPPRSLDDVPLDGAL
jgi:hypothetical protein